MIEDALRDTFASKSAEPPAPPATSGLADSVIRKAGTVRRRHTIVTAAAGVAAVVAAGALIVRILPGDSGGSAPIPQANGGTATVAPTQTTVSPSPQAAGPVEVIVGEEVYAEGKARLKFQPKVALGTVMKVYRALDGSYLVITKPVIAKQALAVQSLLLFDIAGHQSTVVVEKASHIAVSAKGDQVAWSVDGKMSVAERVRDKLVNARTVAAPGDGGPIGFLGRHVVLGRSKNGGPIDAFDVWYADNKYAATWSTNVLRLFGATPKGTALVAQVAAEANEKEACLALLSPDQPFNVQRRACGLPAPMSEGGAISPDGRWLAYPPAAAGTGLILVDLQNVFKEPKVAGTWQLPAAPVAMVWLDSDALVIDAGGQVLRAAPRRFDNVTTVMSSPKGSVLIEPLEP
jgi:hypothetical protein